MPPLPVDASPLLSVVVIGRNEGPRLVRCFESIAAMRSPGPTELIYVDSNSRDNSVEVAVAAGARVIALSSEHITAAAGRNAGWHDARGPLILFLDGDTILDPNFVAASLDEFADPRVAVVFGNRREINPGGSIFNRVLDLDWRPLKSGESAYCGGDAIVRRPVLEGVAGFDERLIAGEEPDMCRRMRGRGYAIMHVDREMTGHDLAMTSPLQYWRRAVRSGYGYAEVAHRYRHTSLPLWLHESRRNLIHGVALVLIVVGALSLAIAVRSLVPLVAAGSIITALIIRSAVRARCRSKNRTTLVWYGLHSQLAHIPILVGQFRFWRDRWLGRGSRLIEYKNVMGERTGRISNGFSLPRNRR